MNFHLQSIHIRPYAYILRYRPEWLGRLISMRCTSQNTETVTGGAGCARTPACSGSRCGCGCGRQSPWPSIDPPMVWSEHMLSNSPLNREKGTLPGLYSALLTWLCVHLASSHYCVVILLLIFPFLSWLLFLFIHLFSFNFSLVSYLSHCTRLCPIVILILSPPPFHFVLFRLCYVFI